MMNLLISVIQTPTFSLLLTVAAFVAGQWFYLRAGKPAWAQPFVTAFFLIVIVLLLLPLTYSRYQEGTVLLQQLLGTSTVALALPIYFHARRIRQYFLPLICTLLVSSALTVVVALLILKLFRVDSSVLISMATKSITTPIAIAVSEHMGGSGSLAAAFVMITGVLGAILGAPLMKMTGHHSAAAQGISFGVTAHALGTVRALEVDQETGAFSALAMGLNGLFTALLLPWVLPLFL
ncbi:Putative effector protein of murein hydrolase [gamma proteobacterium HdN1]|nr:Putative effector protein of murein hydrolase [gamma proteobacterium HdN1]